MMAVPSFVNMKLVKSNPVILVLQNGVGQYTGTI